MVVFIRLIEISEFPLGEGGPVPPPIPDGIVDGFVALGWTMCASRRPRRRGCPDELPAKPATAVPPCARGGSPLLRGAPWQPESVVRFAALVRVIRRRGRVSTGHGSRAAGPQAVGTPAADRARAGRGVGGRRGCLETTRPEERRRWSNGRALARRTERVREIHSKARYGLDIARARLARHPAPRPSRRVSCLCILVHSTSWCRV